MRKAAPVALPDGVQVRMSATARRVSLRVDAALGVVHLVVPERMSVSRAAAFAQQNQVWIGKKLASLPPSVPFVDGAEVPLGGIPHVVRHRPGTRGTVWIEGSEIVVAGAPEHLRRRLTDWLKAEARRRIQASVDRHTAEIGKRPTRISLRDTTTRWGSCTPSGRLAFCWRLILAPAEVMDYVVAHEVAHLIELNHGPRFWKLVGRLVPDTEGPRVWLGTHGTRLHRYG